MKQKSDRWEAYRRLKIPEIDAVIAEIQEEEKAGVFRRPPKHKTKSQILSVEDLCKYVFRKVHLDGNYQVRFADEHVRTWVWNGYDYTDRIVDLVEQVADQVTDKDLLEELRLVATKVTAKGIDRLRRVFPMARVSVFTDEQSDANWRWSQAHYNGQGGTAWQDRGLEEARKRRIS